MTSANFRTIDIDSIIIERDTRQRRTLAKVEELAASIASVGLINPPVVTSDLVLVAGERRLEACRSLGWTALPVQFAEDLDELTLQLIELEENVKRVDLSWSEHNDAIARFHRLKASAAPDWTPAATAEALGMSDSAVTKHLTVKTERERGNEAIETADKFSTALGLAQRSRERARNETQREVDAPLVALGLAPPEPEPEANASPSDRRAEICNENFLSWLDTPPAQPFNLIHCDFPYGVTTGDKKGQSAAKRLGSYDDSEAVYWELLGAFVDNQESFVAQSAHLVFWFSLKHFSKTFEILESAGWKVDPFPLIWHKSDNAGIIPDPARGGRRVYETALFASRGDRKVVRPVANLFSGPTTKEFHTSEKSAAMLQHFFRMLVDGSTRLLDPTCGSGMAIRVAESMGAAQALGLERDFDFALAAKRNCGLLQEEL